eukprot:gene9776-10775_t
MSLACLVFQYRFNYASISQCFTRKPSGFVTTRVVERVYFELPNSPTPELSTGTAPSTRNTRQFTSPSTENPTEKPTCKPKNKIVFLKTHKTGSSTITNILNRYADWNNLTMLLPADEGFYSFNWPNKFRLSYAKNTHGRLPNILANHARYSQKSMNVLFPRNATTYITILREPVKQWESTFSYMSFPYILNIHKKSDPLDFFLKNPPSLKNIRKNANRFPSLYLIKNPLFFDLGLDYKHYSNATMIRRAVKALDNDFNLVLMMEHFDESMVLLKRRMCWSTDDVVFFKTNERLSKNKRRVLTSFQQDSIKTWNSADVALYDYFVERFWKEIEKEGSDFYDDLQELQARKKYYFEKCVAKEAVKEAYTSVFVKGYEMRKNLTGELKLFCERMLTNELTYQDYFKDQYIDRLNKLEGQTIENFENQQEEADIEIEVTDDWGSEGMSYDYGLPTKRPRPPPSRVTQLKTRRQKDKEKTAAATLKAKHDAEKKLRQQEEAKKKKARGSIVKEPEGSGTSGKHQKNSLKENARVADKANKTSGLKKIPVSNRAKNNQSKNKSDGSSGAGSKIPNSGKSKLKRNNQTVFTAAFVPEVTLPTKRKGAGKGKKNDKKATTTIEPTPPPVEFTPPTPKETKPVTLEDKLTTMAQPIDDQSTGSPEMTSGYISYSENSKIGRPMASANKVLKLDDRRRYDGKTIITDTNKKYILKEDKS